jgi:hypothetical protein
MANLLLVWYASEITTHRSLKMFAEVMYKFSLMKVVGKK